MNSLWQKYKEQAWPELHNFYANQLLMCRDSLSIETIRHLLDIAYLYFHKTKHVPISPLPYQIRNQAAFEKEIPQLKKRFPGMALYHSETLYHHHGLRFIAPKAVLDYISTKDIVDIGAYVGDSLVALRNYTTGRVVSYELIPDTYRQALRWGTPQCLIINMGVSNRPGHTLVPRYGAHGSGLHSHGDQVVNITTVDLEVDRLHLTVGMIKADIEGIEPLMIQGAMRTIHRQRPALFFALSPPSGTILRAYLL
jgi:FkbM family methyltransferase